MATLRVRDSKANNHITVHTRNYIALWIALTNIWIAISMFNSIYTLFVHSLASALRSMFDIVNFIEREWSLLASNFVDIGILERYLIVRGPPNSTT